MILYECEQNITKELKEMSIVVENREGFVLVIYIELYKRGF